MSTTQQTDTQGATRSLAFLSLALEANQRTDLNDFGKGATVIVALLALMLEAGATSAEIGEHLRKIQAAALHTAGRLMVAERPSERGLLN